MHPLEPYVQAWRGTADDVIDLLPILSDDDWSKPTDLPGLERARRRRPPRAPRGRAGRPRHGPHLVARRRPDAVAADYTQAGVDARADRSPQELIDELRAAVDARVERLQDLPDPTSKPDTTPGGVDWTWEVLLRNRAIDLWCHEQDIRRAVDVPASSAPAVPRSPTHSFAAGMPFVLGKRVAPPVGTSVVWRITGEVPLEIGAVIGDDGRAAAEVADDPTATLTMTSEAFTVLAAGRRTPDQVDVEIDGDEELGRAVLDAMVLTQ